MKNVKKYLNPERQMLIAFSNLIKKNNSNNLYEPLRGEFR